MNVLGTLLKTQSYFRLSLIC